MIASIVQTVVTIPLIHLCMYTFNFGLTGIPIAQAISTGILLLVTIIYTFCKPETRKVLQPYDWEVFRGWGEYLNVSIPAAVMICAEWWAFEALMVMAGILGVLELAA